VARIAPVTNASSYVLIWWTQHAPSKEDSALWRPCHPPPVADRERPTWQDIKAEKLEEAAASGNSVYGSPMLSAAGGSMSPVHDMSLGAVLTPSASPQPLGADEKETEAAKVGRDGAAHKTAQPIDDAPSEPPASDASEAGDPSDPAPHCGHPEPQMLGNSRIGGAEWVLRRKNEMQNRAYREGMTTRELQVGANPDISCSLHCPFPTSLSSHTHHKAHV